MNTIKEKVEAYVRSQIPELVSEVGFYHQKTIEHPIQLQHWLRMLRIGHKDAEITWSVVNSKVLYLSKDCWKNVISFEDGQPATEADYQAIAEILNIEV